MTSDPSVSLPATTVSGIHHVRLTVTDIGRSKTFYETVFGLTAAIDFSDQVDDEGATEDLNRFYGGTVFDLGGQLLGLRPVAQQGDTFDSTRVGLDHLSLQVGSFAELEAAEKRLDEAGVNHAGIRKLEDAGMAILAIQDPDDINLELVTAL